MGMPVIRMHEIDDIFMGVTVILDLGMMLCHDLGKTCQVMSDNPNICRKRNSNGQCDH